MADTFMRYGSSCEFPFSGYDFHFVVENLYYVNSNGRAGRKGEKFDAKIAIQNHETGNEIENLKVKVGNNEND